MEKVKSFGLRLLERICVNGMTVPILARAAGYHLATFERCMQTNELTLAMPERIALLSESMLVWGVEPITEEELRSWVAAYDAAHPNQRVTLEYAPWDEPIISTEVENVPGGGLPDKFDWLRRNPVFTLAAFRGTFHMSQPAAAQELRSARWRPDTERVGDRFTTVWRWDPCQYPLPAGRSPARVIPKKPAPPTTNGPSLVDRMILMKFKESVDWLYKAGVKQASLQVIAKNYLGYATTNEHKLQPIRDRLKAIGWEYSHSSKLWRPTNQYRWPL
jgi:hypothetical protein